MNESKMIVYNNRIDRVEAVIVMATATVTTTTTITITITTITTTSTPPPPTTTTTTINNNSTTTTITITYIPPSYGLAGPAGGICPQPWQPGGIGRYLYLHR